MEPEQEQEPIQKRLRKLNQNFMATVTLNDPDTLEMLEDMIATIEWMRHRPNIVREVRLSSTRVCRQHFVPWDPQVFMLGPIWQSVSFPSDCGITHIEIYLFVAVLFFVDKNLRDGEPLVWRELNAALDAKFGLPPGRRPT